MTPDRMWETFLKIGEQDPSDATITEGGARLMVQVVREHILPMVRCLERDKLIDWYCYLVHDRSGGVPEPDGERGVYVHMRYSCESGNRSASSGFDNELFPSPWGMTRQMSPPAANEMASWRRLGEQSAMVLRIVERHQDDDECLRQLAVMLHYFSNMTQMRAK